MDKGARLKLKLFLENNIPFHDLKKVGFFGKDVRKTDYEKISARVCQFFGYKSIYEYGKIRVSGILCYGNGVAEWIRPSVDMSCPTNWELLQIDRVEMISKDSWLN